MLHFLEQKALHKTVIDAVSKEYAKGRLIQSMSDMEKIINSKNFGSIIKDVIFKRRQWPSKNKTENDNALTMRNWLKIPSHILYINMHTITLINLPSYWEMYFSFTSYIYVYSSMGFYINKYGRYFFGSRLAH